MRSVCSMGFRRFTKKRYECCERATSVLDLVINPPLIIVKDSLNDLPSCRGWGQWAQIAVGSGARQVGVCPDG